MIGIIGAMDEEVAKLKTLIDNPQTTMVASMEFHRGELGGGDVVVVRSGVGKVNAGICAQILIDKFKVDVLINTGIAGSLDNRIDIGDIVISTDALQHDVDARGFGYDRGQIPRMETLAFAADGKLVEKAVKINKEVNPDINTFTGRIASGDIFVSDKQVKDEIKELFDPMCVEMEGAAIAQAAYLNNIPYVIIRAISDKADGSAKTDYISFEKKAIEHSVRLVEGMLKKP